MSMVITNEAFLFSLHISKEEGMVMSLSVNIAAFKFRSQFKPHK